MTSFQVPKPPPVSRAMLAPLQKYNFFLRALFEVGRPLICKRALCSVSKRLVILSIPFLETLALLVARSGVYCEHGGHPILHGCHSHCSWPPEVLQFCRQRDPYFFQGLVQSAYGSWQLLYGVFWPLGERISTLVLTCGRSPVRCVESSPFEGRLMPCDETQY
jgi:hypothetical protein